jgi:hypothetical protein
MCQCLLQHLHGQSCQWDGAGSAIFRFVESDNSLDQVNLTSAQTLDFTGSHAGTDRQPHHPTQHGIAGLITGR